MLSEATCSLSLVSTSASCSQRNKLLTASITTAKRSFSELEIRFKSWVSVSAAVQAELLVLQLTKHTKLYPVLSALPDSQKLREGHTSSLTTYLCKPVLRGTFLLIAVNYCDIWS